MKRQIKVVIAMVVFAILASGCTLYSNSEGNAGLDGLNIKFTVHSNLSQIMSNIYFGNCGANFGCYQNVMIAADDPGDTVGQGALNDCNNSGCGADEQHALWARALTQPGAGNTNRCVAFDVTYPPGTYFLWGTWNWYRNGNWNCA